MRMHRTLSTTLAAALVALAGLAAAAQDVTPTMDPAMMPTTDPAMMSTTDPAMMSTTDPAMMPTMDPMGGQGVMGAGESASAAIMDASGMQIGWVSFSPSVRLGMPMSAGMDPMMVTTMDPAMMPTTDPMVTTMDPAMMPTTDPMMATMDPATGMMGMKTTVTVHVQGLTPGFHGMHLHMMGNCGDTGEGPFTAAGSHIPAAPQHPNHIGDFPALLVNMDGSAYMSFDTDYFTMADLLDADGTALIIHANPDNYANIPERYGIPDEETLNTGDSGARIACGVVGAGLDNMGLNMNGAMGTNGMMTTDPAMMTTMDPAMMPTTDPMMAATATPGS